VSLNGKKKLNENISLKYKIKKKIICFKSKKKKIKKKIIKMKIFYGK
jgi:hypothetical protein